MGSSLGNLKVGENAVYVATFIINQAAFVRPFIQNKVDIVASAQGLTGNVTDTSDDPDTVDVDDTTRTNMELVRVVSSTSTVSGSSLVSVTFPVRP